MAAVSHGVQRQVARHAVKPATGRAARGVEAAGPVPDIDEGIVHDVFGPGAVTHDALGDAQQPRAFVAVQGLQRRAAPSGALREGCFVIEIRNRSVWHARRDRE